MRNRFFKLLFQFAVVAKVANADTVYITDLPNFSSLAPCAADALSYAVNSLTYDKCPPAVTALASCACTKDNNAVDLSSTITDAVLSGCGTIASEDVSSASVVLNNYCNQDTSATPFAAPDNPVSAYITDLPAYSDLAPCAESGLVYALGTLTYDQCPPGAPALATCACNKNQNSLLVSELINTSVLYNCGTTMSDDVASAQAVFSGYCGLNNGTSDFPTMSELPGSLTYYITDMAEYSSLAPCAQSAVSYEAFFSMTYSYCPGQPGALASCACAKAGISAMITNGIPSAVTDYCASTASADISSALEVFDFYCSAAKGLATPTGITTSVSTSPYTVAVKASKTTSPKYTAGTASKTSSKATGTGSSSGSSSGDFNSDGTLNAKKSTPIGPIIGGVVGGVLVIIAIALGIWFCLRRRKQPQTPPAAITNNTVPPEYSGKSELASTPLVPAPGPQGSLNRKPAPFPSPALSSVSPVTQEKPGELDTPPAQYRAEAPGTANAAGLQPGYAQGAPNQYPQNGYPQNQYPPNQYPQQYQQGNQGYPPPPRQEMDGMSSNMNSGPVYYEMPAQQGWR